VLQCCSKMRGVQLGGEAHLRYALTGSAWLHIAECVCVGTRSVRLLSALCRVRTAPVGCACNARK